MAHYVVYAAGRRASKMKFGSNREGVKWIEITKALLLFKPYIKIEFWKVKTGIKKSFWIKVNA